MRSHDGQSPQILLPRAIGEPVLPVYLPSWMASAVPCYARMKVRDLIQLLRGNGWTEVGTVGSHRQFKHPDRPGRVTVSGHLGADIRHGTLRSVFRQAGLDWARRPR